MAEAELVKVATFFHATEAQTAKSVLELAGIESVLVEADRRMYEAKAHSAAES